MIWQGTWRNNPSFNQKRHLADSFKKHIRRAWVPGIAQSKLIWQLDTSKQPLMQFGADSDLKHSTSQQVCMQLHQLWVGINRAWYWQIKLPKPCCQPVDYLSIWWFCWPPRGHKGQPLPAHPVQNRQCHFHYMERLEASIPSGVMGSVMEKTRKQWTGGVGRPFPARLYKKKQFFIGNNELNDVGINMLWLWKQSDPKKGFFFPAEMVL